MKAGLSPSNQELDVFLEFQDARELGKHPLECIVNVHDGSGGRIPKPLHLMIGKLSKEYRGYINPFPGEFADAQSIKAIISRKSYGQLLHRGEVGERIAGSIRLSVYLD